MIRELIENIEGTNRMHFHEYTPEKPTYNILRVSENLSIGKQSISRTYLILASMYKQQ